VDKLTMHSPDLTQRNIDKVAELFPTVITETKDDEGNVVRAIDFDLLRQELSDHVVEGPRERYQLDWPGKREALFAANAPIAKTLRPVREESVNFDTTNNLFIEGDNLDALKLLQESYLGKVKLIYIDPPYNTGNDFIYNDDFAATSEDYLARSGQVDPAGNRLVANTESNGRFHSDWLSMMYPRLKLARSLMSDDGVIFISIDDHEIDNLLRLSKELFGETNISTTFIRQKKKKPSFLHDNVGSMTEYVVCITRNKSFTFPFSVDTTTAGKKYPINNAGNSLGVLTFPDGSVRFATQTAEYDPQDMSEGNIITRLLDKVTVVGGVNQKTFRLEGEWRYSQAKLDEIVADGDLITISKAPFRPNHVKAGGEVKKMHNLLTPATYGVGTNEDGTAELEQLMGGSYFDNPKPTSLVRVLAQAVTYDDPTAIVLDFFAGSATSAEAVFQLNAENGGSRKFILIQLDEPTDPKSEAAKAGFASISDLSRERIRRAGARTITEAGLIGASLDVGFRALRVDTTNLAEVLRTPDETYQQALEGLEHSVKAGRSGEDLLFQVLIDWGLELTMQISAEEIDGREVFVVEDDALIACFAETVSSVVVREIAERKPLRAVFRDSSFDNDAARINAEQIFREISPSTDVKAI
jgi:adenine-specific DNA-methyltransferase